MQKNQKQKAIAQVLLKRKRNLGAEQLVSAPQSESAISDVFYKFEKFLDYQTIKAQQDAADQVGIRSPYFILHDGCARDTTTIDGKNYINYGTYNYLDLNGHPDVNTAAAEALETYGTSASASRLVAGERPPHVQFETELADFYGTEAAITFVSGHATNVSTIGTLFGQQDLILHDKLIHNSILQGIKLSGAKRQPFGHNDWQELDRLLERSRHHFEKALIVVEGLYGMDGDIAPLDKIVEIAKKHKTLVMVDEAHSLGTVGKTGRGTAEHFGLAKDDVDIWMGTLSKTLAGCGGYIAGSKALIEILKYGASGFVYSVGMPPAMAAASNTALTVLRNEPERVEKLHKNGKLFLEYAQSKGLDTGLSEGYGVVPVKMEGSLRAVHLSDYLMEHGICVAPIIYPAVEEKAARLRFFLSSAHTEEQIKYTVNMVVEGLKSIP